MVGETVTVRRAATTTDRYGNTVRDWTSVTDTDVDGCAVAPNGAPETTSDGREAAVERLTIYMPVGSDVEATDRVVVRGDVYDVDSEPSAWTSPYSGTARGVEVTARRSQG